jgi:hypothetical protein
LKVLGNRGLRRIFGSKAEEGTEGWRMFNKEDKIGHVACTGEILNAYKILVANLK